MASVVDDARAENVARHAPPTWHSFNTVIDKDMETIEWMAQSKATFAQRDGSREPVVLPRVSALPPEDLAITRGVVPAVTINQREVWFIHPWSLGHAPAQLPGNAVHVAGFETEIMQRWPWRRVDDWWNYINRPPLRIEQAEQLNRVIETTPNSLLEVAVPVAGITDLHNHVIDGTVKGHCDCMFMVNTHRWDFGQLAALIAPRPLLIANSDKDPIFPLDGVIRVHSAVARIYALHKASEKLGLLITEGPHKDTQDLQVPAFRWFNRFLKAEEPLITTAAEKLFEPRELRVLPPGGQPAEIGRAHV